VLGGYLIEGEIGGGGMGRVFRARHTFLDRIVALKVLRPDRRDDPDLCARFLREMKGLGRLDHPNVIRATDAGQQGDLLYLVMDYVEGTDLNHLVERLGPLAPAVACELIRQAALGLEYIRAQGLVHRDIKPSNLLLSTAGVVKVLDLGLVRFEHPEGEQTPTDCVMGTGDYLAPEQASHAHAADIRADIYSLGCTLYKLLCGRVPYSSPGYSSLAQKIVAHREVPFPELRCPLPVPEGLDAVLARMTTKNPDDRFATPAEVAEALAPFAAGAAVSALLNEARDPALAGPEVTSDASTRGRMETVPGALALSPTPALPAKGAGRRLVWVAEGAALALILIGLLVWTWRSSEGSRRLDDLPPYQSHDLLTREPLSALWEREAGHASFTFERAQKQFTAVSASDSLFHLGEIHREHYTLQVKISQLPRWTGGCGVYLGYRDVGAGEPAALQDRPALARFQFVMLQVHGAPPKLKVVRGMGTVRKNAAGPRVIDWEDLDSQVLPENPREDALLELTVVGSRLKSLSLGGLPLHRLTGPKVNNLFQPEDYRGWIGLCNRPGTTIFREAQIKLHDAF
jgi:serine/threonine protein kinase